MKLGTETDFAAVQILSQPIQLWCIVLGLRLAACCLQICRVLQSASATRVFDKEQGVPYVYQDDDWFGYEDVQSLQGKVGEWQLVWL